MRQIFKEYINILGYITTGIVFGFCTFILLINLYHYRSVNEKFVNQGENRITSSLIKQKIEVIRNNASFFDINKYSGQASINELASIQSRINICTKVLDSDKAYNIIDKEKLDIYDVYRFQQYYQMDVANECLIKQIYELSLEEESTTIPSLVTIKPFLYTGISDLKEDTEYVKKVLKNNSSYYFSSEISNSDIYDMVGDSYNEILNKYLRVIDFISDISSWYKKEIGG